MRPIRSLSTLSVSAVHQQGLRPTLLLAVNGTASMCDAKQVPAIAGHYSIFSFLSCTEPARVASVRDGLSECGRYVWVIMAGNNCGYQVALVDLGQENFIGQVLHKIDQQLQLSPRIWETESEDDC